MPSCFIALGGNLGAVSDTFRRAMEKLDAVPHLTVRQMSRIYRSAPVGEQAQEEFCNAVAEIETNLEPLALLDLLQIVETELGRKREVHWGPRTLDLDLILYGDEVVDHPRLQVPHPACWYRRFVLDPMAEIAGGVFHPERQITFAELRSRILARPLPVALAGATDSVRNELMESLSDEFPDAAISQWNVTDSTGSHPALLIWLGNVPEDNDTQQTAFGTLPISSRLDATSTNEDPVTFLRHVLQSALLELRVEG